MDFLFKEYCLETQWLQEALSCEMPTNNNNNNDKNSQKGLFFLLFPISSDGVSKPPCALMALFLMHLHWHNVSAHSETALIDQAGHQPPDGEFWDFKTWAPCSHILVSK